MSPAPALLALVGLALGAAGAHASAGGDVARTTLASVPALQADSLVDEYGVNTHLGFFNTPYADPAAVAGALKDLGVRHVRDGLVLGSTGARQYAAINSVAQSGGVRFDLIMGRPDSGSTPADFVNAAATQLPAGTVESLEGVNEWDLFGPQAQQGSGQPAPWIQQDKDWQHGLYAAAKSTAATAGLPVLAPSLAFFATSYAAAGDLSADEDVANLHVYPGGYRPSNQLPQATAALRTSIPSTPLTVTETGYHNATGSSKAPVPESVAGVYAPRILLEHAKRGEQRVYTYELVDEFSDPNHTNPEADYGLLHTDFSPKPAFTAIKNLLALVSDPGPTFTTTPLTAGLSGMPSDARYLLYQKRDGSYVLLLWRDVDVFDPSAQQAVTVTPANVTLGLGQSATLSLYHPSVSATAVSTTTGSSLAVTLDGQVTAITIAAPATSSSPSTSPSASPSTPPTGSGSPTTSATTSPSPTATTAPPSAPSRVTARPGVRQATVSWSEATAAGPVTGFEISRAPGGTTRTVGPAVSSFTDTGLDPRGHYTYSVRALGAGGASAFVSAPAVAAALAPGRPAIVSARSVPGGLEVTWHAASPNGLAVTSYRLTCLGRTLVVPARTRDATITLPAGHRVRVRLQARNAIGWGAASVSGYVTVAGG